MRCFTAFVAVLLALSGFVHAEGSIAKRCESLYVLTDADAAVEPGVLISASDEVPMHCRVRGVIDNTIRFEVSMPAEGWTGRFMYHAPGGLAGVVGDTTSLLEAGFAAATTDTGHESENDSSFYRDDNAKINFAFRANHLTANLAKRIIAAFYGRPADYSYLWGCSNGGRAGLIEALRYPDDFDGIIAGAPALDYGHGLLAWALENVRHQARAPLTPESVAVLDANTKRACDMIDGVADGVIGDPRKCTVERLALHNLKCDGDQSTNCLTESQIETARYIYTGITDEASNVIVPGVYPGAELGGDFELWITGPVPFLPGTASHSTVEVIEAVMHRDPSFQLEAFNPLTDMPALKELMYAIDVPPPDFSRFRESGGKLIIYNGWHDQPCRAKNVETYYAQALELNDPDTLGDYFRAFLVPGMAHCAGGPGAWAADYVQAIVSWVEQDAPPDRIVAEHPGDFTFLEAMVALDGQALDWSNVLLDFGESSENRKRFSRPLCPYPAYAQYTGSGDVNDEANFECVVD